MSGETKDGFNRVGSAGKTKVTYVPVSEIKPYKHNPRDNSDAVDKVAASIREFGFKVPLVITQDGEIVTGHTRIEAAKRLGIEEVPCIVADDLTDEQVRAFRLADNKVGEFSKWDDAWLSLELVDIPDIDMSQFGFDAMFSEMKERDEKSESERIVEAMELRQFEHHDYVVFVFDNQFDWLNVVDKFGLHRVDAGFGETRKIGLGRVVDGRKLLEVIGDKGADSEQREERDDSKQNSINIP